MRSLTGKAASTVGKSCCSWGAPMVLFAGWRSLGGWMDGLVFLADDDGLLRWCVVWCWRSEIRKGSVGR